MSQHYLIILAQIEFCNFKGSKYGGKATANTAVFYFNCGKNEYLLFINAMLQETD